MLKLIDVIKMFAELCRVRSDQKDAASKSFRVAQTETLIHLGDLLAGNASDRGQQQELARHWSEASTDLVNRDVALSDSCRALSEYWAAPEIAPEDAIEEIREHVAELFAKGRDDGSIHLSKPQTKSEA